MLTIKVVNSFSKVGGGGGEQFDVAEQLSEGVEWLSVGRVCPLPR